MKTNEMNHKSVEEKLNNVLADLQVIYQNFRTMHWLVKGPDFYMLHKMYEGFYNETAEVVDEVAERILTLEGLPLHHFSDYLEHATVKSVTVVPAGKESLKIATENFSHLLNAYRDILALASKQSDEGTVALMSEFIASTEKKLWMLKSTLA